MSVRGFHLMESEMWCFYDFTSRNDLDLAANIIVTSFIFIATLTIVFSYTLIYLKIYNGRKDSGKILHQLNNQKIAKKFIIITTAYFLAYAPSYITFMYRLGSRSKIMAELEMFTTFLTLCQPSITVFLLFYLNTRYRNGLRKLFPRIFTNMESDVSTRSSARKETSSLG